MVVEEARAVMRGVGRRVAELRRQAGLTQEQVAERGDVSVRYWRRIETGRENLTLSALVWLANLLGVRTAELMEYPADLTIPKGRPRRAGVGRNEASVVPGAGSSPAEK